MTRRRFERAPATAEAQLRAAGLSARDRATLARTGSLVLRAPRAGRVLRLEVREGDPVPGDRPLVVLAGEGAVRVEGRFSGAYPEGATPVLRTDRGDVPLCVVGEPLADPETGLRIVFFEPIGPTTLREGERFPLALVGAFDDAGATVRGAFVGAARARRRPTPRRGGPALGRRARVGRGAPGRRRHAPWCAAR
ncbi:MAG: hypothetical protein H6722_06605 [Sandaracinus sp.]|nr:hypothetical protein [Sandaracinus sp.]